MFLPLQATDLSKEESDDVDDWTEGLARFEIGQLAVGVTLNSEDAIQLQCTLQSVSMVDIRPNSELAVKKLVIFSHFQGILIWT